MYTNKLMQCLYVRDCKMFYDVYVSVERDVKCGK